MSRVLMVVLDAADADLVWRWADEGRLPALGRLMDDGARARLTSPGDLMPEAAWPTLLTGATTGEHGVYNWRPVRPRTYDRTRQPPGSYRKSVWQLLVESQPNARTVVFDAPFSTVQRTDRITEVVGWGERGAARSESWPAGLIDEIVDRHGKFPRWTEEDYIRTRFGERRLVSALEGAIARRTEILLELLHGRDWQLAVACFYELHNGGHAVYRHLHPHAHGYRKWRAAPGESSLLGLYQAADAAVGRLRDEFPDADFVVCSPKGLRPNTNGEAVLPQLLERLGHQAPGMVRGSSRRLVLARRAVRAMAPRPLRRWVFGRVTPVERDRMLEQLWSQSIDWERTRAFAEPEYGHGWIRLNVRGREPGGVVEPGEQYEALCAEIAEELGRVTHPESGAPAVAAVSHRDSFAAGPNADKLPDLVVTWAETEILDRVHHPTAGVVREDMSMMPTAEHTGRAFLIGSGSAFAAGSEEHGGRLQDVAATVLHLTGAPLPDDMDGRVLTGLLDSDGDVARAPVAWHQDPWELSQAPSTS